MEDWAHALHDSTVRGTGGQDSRLARGPPAGQCRVGKHLHVAFCPCRPPGPSSKFRHAQGTVLHRDSHITNLKGLSLTTPGESDGFCANRLRVAVPLLSSGGQVAVLEVRSPSPLQLSPESVQDAKGIEYPHQPTFSERKPCARHLPSVPPSHLMWGCHSYPHFTDESGEAQRSLVTCWVTQLCKWWSWEFKPRPPESQA